MTQLKQIPDVGEHRLYFRGDTLKFTLKLDSPLEGKAFVRTNIGRAFVQRREIILKVKERRSGSAQDWHDIPMQKVDDKTYSITLALLEVGHFEAMCFFFPENTTEPTWPGGDNVCINVEPAEFCCANSIYCAFPRQFGPNKNNAESKPIKGLTEQRMNEFDKEGFTIIPPSGTFRDLIKELDFIINTLNCRIIHLLPINPTPTVYARMGRYGSPYASLDFTNIDPSLAVFDKKATPLEQFLELVDEIHHKNAKLIIDVAINHTGWAAKVHEEHPEWLVRKEDKTIVSPGAWGVTWGDLTELDHNQPELWEYLAEMFLTWCERGVDGFRCDAGYMVPFKAWEYIITKVREQYPDTIYLLEGLGGDPAITLNLLNKANMNWAYSELFQNYSKNEIQDYISRTHKINLTDGLMVHYAETHDNSRLADNSEIYAKMRTGLCALLSSNGAFGFTNGVEWYAKEKIDVHLSRALNWGAETNQISFIARINNILVSHSAFYEGSSIDFFKNQNDKVLTFIRTDHSRKNKLLIIINLDCKDNASVTINLDDLDNFGTYPFYDLLTEKNYISELNKNYIEFKLMPGEILCLTTQASNRIAIAEAEDKNTVRPDKIDQQRAQAMALDILCSKDKTNILSEVDIPGLVRGLLRDPIKFCESVYSKEFPAPLIHWEWPRDLHRKVIIPPEHMVIVTAPYRFRASIVRDGKVTRNIDSLIDRSGRYFVVIVRKAPTPKCHTTVTMKISVYKDTECEHNEADVLLLAADSENCKISLNVKEIRDSEKTFFDGNKRGGMLRACLKWGEINDRYNALLAANLNTSIPVDRHIMLNRCRAWIIRHGRPEKLNISTTESFTVNPNGGGTWTFHVPVGNGLYVDISIAAVMLSNKNAIRFSVYRHPTDSRTHYLDDNSLVHFIFRPDIEDRNFHQDTKLTDQVTKSWKSAVTGSEKGFTFSPVKERKLKMLATKGFFKIQPETQHSIYRKTEEERGFEPNSDLFSPGYFNIGLSGGEHAEVTAQILTPKENKTIDFHTHVNFKYLLKAADNSFDQVLLHAIKKFVVKRDNLKTVIAGYPWFLDWGRDTLICVRGLIAAGMYDDVKEILLQFAKFATGGKLPNIIYGEKVGNWDTSDAPLWLIVVTEDYCNALGNNDILDVNVNENRTYLEALKSVANGYIKGTSNGIKVDKESKLVYSPPHFTWMDTNYPAGTPREGYPIEIQALWYAGLKFLASVEQGKKWEDLSEQVKSSINNHFLYEEIDGNGKLTGEKWLSDCLHCSPMKPASESIMDDHIRPNQLFAITLGAVTDFDISRAVLKTTSQLLIPGAIRSLADRKTSFKLSILNHGKLLNNPLAPYWGTYKGVEDVTRKPAYHNGTAWTWPFPSYCEAYYMLYGQPGLKHAISILSSSQILLEEGCLGQMPEILDGNFPHKQRGCDAQAWGVTELYRVWKLLHEG